MATTITIKRYDSNANNGTGSWVEYAPTTKVANITDGNNTALQDILDGKQTTSNIITSFVSSGTGQNTNSDTKYPSAKLVWDTTENIREVAEGKTSSFVTRAVPTTTTGEFYFPCGTTNVQENSQYTISELRALLGEVTVTSSSSSLSFDGFGSTTAYLYKTVVDSGGNWEIEKSIPLSSLKVGDVILLTNTDLPDFWVAEPTTAYYGLSMSKLETAKVPIENYQLLVDEVEITSTSGTLSSSNINKLTSDDLNYIHYTYGAIGASDGETVYSFDRRDVGTAVRQYTSVSKNGISVVTVNTSTGAYALTSYGKSTTYVGSSSQTPANPVEGDLWFVTS